MSTAIDFYFWLSIIKFYPPIIAVALYLAVTNTLSKYVSKYYKRMCLWYSSLNAKVCLRPLTFFFCKVLLYSSCLLLELHLNFKSQKKKFNLQK